MGFNSGFKGLIWKGRELIPVHRYWYNSYNIIKCVQQNMYQKQRIIVNKERRQFERFYACTCAAHCSVLCSPKTVMYEGHTGSHEQSRVVGNSATSNDWVSFDVAHYFWYDLPISRHVVKPKTFCFSSSCTNNFQMCEYFWSSTILEGRVTRLKPVTWKFTFV